MYHEHPSPNFNQRPAGDSAQILVLHYTGMLSMQAALDRMCDPKVEVSAHYMVDEDGSVYRLVNEKERAWHAGLSFWRGRERINDISIGIEIVNPGHEHGYRPFPSVQMDSVIKLSKEIIRRHNIKPYNVVGHSDIAPDRKEDPGELFDWKGLAAYNIGLWADSKNDYSILCQKGERSEAVIDIQNKLSQYGYGIKPDGIFGTQTQKVVIAFQRHFCPVSINGEWNKMCQERLEYLLELSKKCE